MAKRGTYAPEETRRKLMEAAMEEIHRNGYRASGLDTILKRAGVTKGALYHHFANKDELGLAVIEELVADMIITRWETSVTQAENPLMGLIAYLRGFEVTEEELTQGCPLNNLANEMSPVDETFRMALNSLVNRLRALFADGLTRAQQQGQMRADVAIAPVVSLVVCTLEGAATVGKSAQDMTMARQAFDTLADYLESLAVAS